MKKKVLIIEDSQFMRMKIREALLAAGCNIVGEAGDGESALEMIKKVKPDIITLDNILPDTEGVDLLKIIKSAQPKIHVIIISSLGLQSTINDTLALGADYYLVKPFTAEEIQNVIGKID